MKKLTKNKKLLMYSVLVLLIITIGCFVVYDNYCLETTEYTVESNRLPREFNNFKIIQISDLHNTSFGKNNEDLIKIIKNENPDAIFVTGDSIDGFYTNIEVPISLFKELLEITDIYFVVGNHELRSNTNQYMNFINRITEIGVIVLKDESAYINMNDEIIQIIGLNDSTEYKATYGDDYKEQITFVTNNLDDKKCYSILLSHHPELFPEYKETNVDLVFSGHAHGGQFRLPFVGGVAAPDQGLFPEYDAGVFTENNTTMVVSRGLGNSFVPLRINNSPEVVIVTLKTTD